jgi:hypothetical protein
LPRDSPVITTKHSKTAIEDELNHSFLQSPLSTNYSQAINSFKTIDNTKKLEPMLVSTASQASLPINMQGLQENREYVLDLQFKFQNTIAQMQQMEQENQRLHQLLSDSQEREKQYLSHLDQMNAELQDSQLRLQKGDSLAQGIFSLNNRNNVREKSNTT